MTERPRGRGLVQVAVAQLARQLPVPPLDEDRREVRFRIGVPHAPPPGPFALGAGGPISSKVIAEGLWAFVEGFLADPRAPRAGLGFLRREAPRVAGVAAGQPLLADGEEPADVEARVVAGLGERGVLVRAGAALGRAGALRVTYGTPAQNARFLGELGALL